MVKKQTAVKLILDKFNLLSDADFKSWMLNHHDELIQMEREQMKQMYVKGIKNYNPTYGGQDDNHPSNS